jgi:hypothetical protein
MGIDVDNSLLIGCSYEELEDFFELKIGQGATENYCALEDPSEVIETYFEYASPYYDSPIESWFIGFKIPNYQEVTDDWYEVVKETAHQFELLTGVKPRIRGGSHVR